MSFEKTTEAEYIESVEALKKEILELREEILDLEDELNKADAVIEEQYWDMVKIELLCEDREDEIFELNNEIAELNDEIDRYELLLSMMN